jgi:hypothetical protein
LPLVIAGIAEAEVTVRAREALLVPVPLVAVTVTLEVPAVVGVPEIKPETALAARPCGSPDALKLVGELLAVI